MNNDTPKYLKDLDHRAAGLPFGELEVTVTRHRSRTTKVTYLKESKIQPKDNPEAFSDLEKLINAMINATFDGKLAFGIEFKKGTIKEIVIKNKEVKNYGTHQNSQSQQ